MTDSIVNKFMDGDDINAAWSKFCEFDEEMVAPIARPREQEQGQSSTAPKCSPLNISTKTKICYLNTPIDLKEVFWRIPLVKYHDPRIGVVKKQMKFNSETPEEVDVILQHKLDYAYVDDYILKQVNVTNGRNKFKDIRKISIGVCRKDITSYRCKKKSAFYNCFVVIMRLFHNDVFKEINVKVFNTGKLGISGIQDNLILNKVLDLLVEILTPILPVGAKPLAYINEKSETVMINSNFSCGYYINREKMYKLLKYKYKINSNFDSCSYPGIQCEFYYDSLLTATQTGIQPASGMLNGKKHKQALAKQALAKQELAKQALAKQELAKQALAKQTLAKQKQAQGLSQEQQQEQKQALVLAKQAQTLANKQALALANKDSVKVSFMIFRTGSVLIVGKCTEEMLYEIYEFLCGIFETDYQEIRCSNFHETDSLGGGDRVKKEKVRKIRKKMVASTTASD